MTDPRCQKCGEIVPFDSGWDVIDGEIVCEDCQDD